MYPGEIEPNFLLNGQLIEPHAHLVGGVRADPKMVQVLVHLRISAPETVSTQALLDDVWGDVLVGDNTVHQAIANLRKLLGDNAKAPEYIETIPRRGYRLIASVCAVEDRQRTITPSPTVMPQTRLGIGLILSIAAVAAAFAAGFIVRAYVPVSTKADPSHVAMPDKQIDVTTASMPMRTSVEPGKSPSQLSQDLYKQAKAMLGNFQLDAAIALAGQALDTDSSNHRAHALIAQAYLTKSVSGAESGAETIPRAARHVGKALEINSRDAHALALRGRLRLVRDRDLAGAYEDVVAAWALEPDSAFNELQLLYRISGRQDEQLAIVERMSQLRPADGFVQMTLARLYYFQLGWKDRGLAQYEHIRERFPTMPTYWNDQIYIALFEGFDARTVSARFDDLLGRMTTGKPLYELEKRYTVAFLDGDEATMRQCLAELEAHPDANAMTRSWFALLRGDSDENLRQIELGIERYEPWVAGVFNHYIAPSDWPQQRALLEDPRLKELLRRVGIDQVSVARVKWRSLSDLIPEREDLTETL